MTSRFRLLTAVALAAALAGCHTRGEIVVNEGVGITAIRSQCPAVGIPDYTGDITLFRKPGDKTESNMDVEATMTDVRTHCSESPDKVTATAQFKVLGRRFDTHGARQVTLPYFVTVLRGGTAVITKRVGKVTLNFADGQANAQATGEGTAYINRAAATLPEDIRRRITRKRKAGDADAAVDPLADPKVQAAVRRATFELLVGFQLNQDQLAYNATR